MIHAPKYCSMTKSLEFSFESVKASFFYALYRMFYLSVFARKRAIKYTSCCKPNSVVLLQDESHFIKNFKAARTRAVSDVVKKSKYLVLLSGTPALSRPVELFTQLNLLRHDLFPRFQSFALRYCGARQVCSVNFSHRNETCSTVSSI